MKKIVFVIMFCPACSVIVAQVDVDKPIRLTGSASDARVEGIQSIEAPEDAVNARSVQRNALVFEANAGGMDNAYSATLSPAPEALIPGMTVIFKAGLANTGAATLDVNGLGEMPIRKNVSDALAADDIKAGQVISVIYDGEAFQLISAGGGSSSGGAGVTDFTHMYLGTFR
jgi:hypothetical protein